MQGENIAAPPSNNGSSHTNISAPLPSGKLSSVCRYSYNLLFNIDWTLKLIQCSFNHDYKSGWLFYYKNCCFLSFLIKKLTGLFKMNLFSRKTQLFFPLRTESVFILSVFIIVVKNCFYSIFHWDFLTWDKKKSLFILDWGIYFF